LQPEKPFPDGLRRSTSGNTTGGIVTPEEQEKLKQWKAANKEHCRMTHKTWVEKNKDRIREYRIARKSGIAIKDISDWTPKHKRLKGKRFGRLTAIEYLPTFKQRNGKGSSNAGWRCICDCGNEINTTAGSLRDGYTRSCGCLRKEETSARQRLPTSEAAKNAILFSYKKGARKRSLAWELSNDEFLRMISSNCHYCGAPPVSIMKGSPTRPMNGEFRYNGIDRKDNTIGYTTENAVACCAQCNRAKSTTPYDEFKEWIRRTTGHLNPQAIIMIIPEIKKWELADFDIQ
jgi:hypothetical protein